MRINKFLTQWINGFCKFISELPPRQQVILEENKTPSALKGRPQDFSWHSVPVGEVRDLSKESNSNISVTNLGSGSEKSPHKRRGHWRKYKNPDGSIKYAVWIDETTVRADKLETENLKGSAMIIKEK